MPTHHYPKKTPFSPKKEGSNYSVPEEGIPEVPLGVNMSPTPGWQRLMKRRAQVKSGPRNRPLDHGASKLWPKGPLCK